MAELSYKVNQNRTLVVLFSSCATRTRIPTHRPKAMLAIIYSHEQQITRACSAATHALPLSYTHAHYTHTHTHTHVNSSLQTVTYDDPGGLFWLPFFSSLLIRQPNWPVCTIYTRGEHSCRTLVQLVGNKSRRKTKVWVSCAARERDDDGVVVVRDAVVVASQCERWRFHNERAAANPSCSRAPFWSS